MLTFRDGRFSVQDVADEGFFITKAKILDYIRQADDPAFSPSYIAQIAHACTDRMQADTERERSANRFLSAALKQKNQLSLQPA